MGKSKNIKDMSIHEASEYQSVMLAVGLKLVLWINAVINAEDNKCRPLS